VIFESESLQSELNQNIRFYPLKSIDSMEKIISHKQHEAPIVSSGSLLQTPSQTVGPYFAYGLAPEQYLYDFRQLVGNQMVNPIDVENVIMIFGKVFDGAGQPIPDAMIEIWQNDGKTQLFGRFGTGTDPQNRFIFYTTKPQSINNQAPYLSIIVFMRGQLIHAYTRMYFPEESELNSTDEVLNATPVDRKHTLVSKKNGNTYEFNIFMQGENETVFFDI
jgi:protocatechuate 3,4-dioxygenase, alpha subunit